MDNRFFERPILNSPYEYPARHWELDASGQPTQQIIETRRYAKFRDPGEELKKLVVLVGGGTKKRQAQDIATAGERWMDYKKRKKQP